MQNKLFLVLTLSLVLGVFSASEVFAEIDYDEIKIESISTVLFERSDVNIIVATVQLSNNSDEKFPSSGNYFYLVSSGKYFDEVSAYEIDIGDKVCPSFSDIPSDVSREIILCYEVPKNLPNSSYSLEIMDSRKSWCDDALTSDYRETCQELKKSILSPHKVNYDEYIKKFILKNTDIQVDFNSIDLIEQPEFNILNINFDVSNLSSDEIIFYPSSIFAITPDGTSYTSQLYNLANIGYSEDECSSWSIEINPKLTKSYSYCFEVPQGINTFDLAIREGQDIWDCDTSFSDCTEYILNISNPNFVALNQPIPDPVETTTESTSQQDSSSNDSKIQELEKKIKELESANKKLQSTIDELQSKLTQSGDSTPKIKKEIASFVDKTKDPQSYVDRYKNESSYKEWFNENYPDYDSIYEAVGKRQPIPDWIKNNAIWWSEGKLSEDEFVGGIEYLVKNNIINVN